MTEQDKAREIELTTNQVKKAPNPTGKGGFGDNPQNRSDGRWSKDNSYSYWLNKFKGLTLEEFLAYPKDHPDMSMAALAAHERINRATEDLKEFEVAANRTEGMPRHTLGFDSEDVITKVEIITRSKDPEDGDRGEDIKS